MNHLDLKNRQKGDLADVHKTKGRRNGKMVKGDDRNKTAIGFGKRQEIVNGEVSTMHPVVRDEIFPIAQEAIRNACQHSGADRLEVQLTYAHDFTLNVRDNGRGVAPEIVTKGRHGHFGLKRCENSPDGLVDNFGLRLLSKGRPKVSPGATL